MGSFLLFAIVFIGTHFFAIPRSSKAVTEALNGLEIFDKKPSYTSDDVYSRIEMFPQNGLLLYKQFTYTIDILFPTTLFTFLFLLSWFVIKKVPLSRTTSTVLIALPITWLTMDLIENAIIFKLLTDFPLRQLELAGSLGYITIAKFCLLLLSILAPTTMITVSNFRKRTATNS
jgi:hypothetical protein